MSHRDQIPIWLLRSRLGPLKPVLRRNLWWERIKAALARVVRRRG